MLTVLDIPERRAFLEKGVFRRMRELFARDKDRALPSVEFISKADATRRGLPSTSWYDFRTTSVGLFVDEDLSQQDLFVTLAWHAAHEAAHWIADFPPKMCGARDQVDFHLWNILADGANEQRFSLASRWVRRIVTRGRRTVLPHVSKYPLPEAPLWAAAYLTLRAHTVLACGRWGLLAAARELPAEEAASRVWAAVAPQVGEPPEAIAGAWPEAWRLTWEAWTADSRFDLFESVKGLRALFPEPEEPEPPPSPLSLDAHEGSDAEECSGEPSPLPATPLGAGEEEEDGDGAKGDAAPGAEEEDPSTVERDVYRLNEPARMWAPLRGRRIPTLYEEIAPARGLSLPAKMQQAGTELGRTLEISARPSVRRAGVRGRVRTNIVARDEFHPAPFRERVREELSLTEACFVGVMLDTSGSMVWSDRIGAVREAAMTIAIACERARTPHVIVTSRTISHVAGDGLPLHQAAALIAGITPGGDEGFPTTLGPFLREIAGRPEPVKVAVVAMDGIPVGPPLGPFVEEARKAGVIVVGLGLDLTDAVQVDGLKKIFGASDSCVASRGAFARKLGTVVSAAIARGRR